MTLARTLASALHLGLWERDDAGRLRRGTWSQSYSGHAYWVLDPRPEEIHFDDICMGLATEVRYRGQTREPLSVAEHSVVVSLYAERLARARNLRRGYTYVDPIAAARAGLLHDAGEAFLGDISRPLKHRPVMRGYRRLEAKWERAIAKRFGLTSDAATLALVKEVDDRVVLDEVEALFLDPDMWRRRRRYYGVRSLSSEFGDVAIAAMDWRAAASAFCQRFAEMWPEWTEVDPLACPEAA